MEEPQHFTYAEWEQRYKDLQAAIHPSPETIHDASILHGLEQEPRMYYYDEWNRRCEAFRLAISPNTTTTAREDQGSD
jgi:hypothetical protein